MGSPLSHRCAPPAQVSESQVPRVEAIVDEELARGGGEILKRKGKKVLELRPRVEWHKGAAVLWLLDALQEAYGTMDGLTPPLLPMYIGDDITDEDAFQALHSRPGGCACVIVAEDPKARPTHAQMFLRNTDEVCTFLQALAKEGKSLAERGELRCTGPGRGVLQAVHAADDEELAE